MEKEPGCPFNNFGPCREAECRFFIKSDDEYPSECAITATAINSCLTRCATDLGVAILNSTGHALGITGCRIPSGPEYARFKMLLKMLSPLAQLPSVSAENRKRLSRESDIVQKVIEVLYHHRPQDKPSLCDRLSGLSEGEQALVEKLFPHEDSKTKTT